MSEKKEQTRKEQRPWLKIIQGYNKPNLVKSWGQVANSFLPYFGLWVAMYYSLAISYWLTLGISIFAAGFLMRIFIIFHDCGHGSFFVSERANRVMGIIAAGFLFTPYHKWQEDHRIHHATAGNLDNKGVGDVRTFTVEEYKNFKPWQKQLYKLYRNPIMLFFIGPLILFLIIFRFPPKDRSVKEKVYTHLTTLGLILAVVIMSYWIGLVPFIKIQLPILFVAAGHGAWLFFVQHTFEDTVWERQKDWDFETMSLNGSSYLKLPRILQWFTGNVCIHHIHHLCPAIPNYKLKKCYDENPLFQLEKPLTFWSSLKCLKYKVWDEKSRKLISFKEIK
jgi:omega-6 fatty acid desaturase (delta-12 desaturase)